MKLPDLREFDLRDKRVLVRVDFDVPLERREGEKAGGREEWEVGDDTRIQNALPTINYLLAQKAKIILLSHLGRPEGKVVPDLSLEPVARKLQELLPQIKIKLQIGEDEIILLENLRFNPGEEANDPGFDQELTSLEDFYVNEAFAVCHRKHASIVGLPKLLPHAGGLSLLREVEVLSSVLENPRRPVVVIFGGAKEDKLEVVPGLLNFADKILIGGKLPSIITNNTNKYQLPMNNKLIVGELNQEGKDITLETVEKFAEVIKKAGTIVWSGPLGKFEEPGFEKGTKIFAQAIVEGQAFKIIGGGDTEVALTKFGLVSKIDFVSSGGGAMLEFLADGDLPGLTALRETETDKDKGRCFNSRG